MKRIFAVALIAAISVSLFKLIQPEAEAAQPGVSASAAVLMDGESGRLLYAKNADVPRPIASITKLMTALVAVELCPDLGRRVTIRAEWTGAEGSSMYLKPGEELTLEGLLYGLLLSSGNDAAVAIAGACAGSVEEFVARMNERAAALGMTGTHFANPNGLDDPAHYSTAADMALLAREILQREELMRIVSTRSITVAGRTLTNHNKLLWRYSGCTGMKTGYTDEAGRTLVSSAQRDGQSLIVVTLNDPDDWADHASLFDYGFSAWPRTLLCLGGRTKWNVPVTGSVCRFAAVEAANDVYYPLSEEERVTSSISLPEQVEAPVEAGTRAGWLTFYLNGEAIGRTELVYAQDVADNRAPEGWLTRLFG